VSARRKRRRTPARRRGASSRARSRRPRVSPRLSREQLEKLEQRQLDVIGMTLIAIGVYLTFVLYMGWDGGKIGGGAHDALTYLFGKVAYLSPLALFAAGAALICKPFLPAIRPLRTGGIFIIAGLLLAFAAQTAHLGADHPLRPGYFDSSWFPQHGGLIGDGLYWATATLFQRIGAHIIAVLLICAGVLLLTGTSIATFVSGTGKAITKARESSAEMARTVAQTKWGQEEQAAAMETQVAATDVMSEYPDEDLEPEVRVVEFDHDPAPDVDDVPDSEAPTGEMAVAAHELADEGSVQEDHPPAADAERGASDDDDLGRAPSEQSTRAEILCFWIEADAFMRKMVRTLVGTMLEVAGGQRSVDDFEALLRGAERERAGETAPAHGLYLAEVRY
jgi:DNA segregation ATPase FtsK/SpoIIIE, S-DNA-T family